MTVTEAPAAGAGTAVNRFLSLLPAWLAAEAVLGCWALAAALPADRFSAADVRRIAVAAGVAGTLALLRALPLLFLLSWPLLRLQDRHRRMMAVAAAWSLALLLQVALDQYFLAARVPLGADLFGYSWAELRTTAVAGIRTDLSALAGWGLPMIALLAALYALRRGAPHKPRRAVVAGVLLASFAAWLTPLQPAAQQWPDEDAYTLALNKPGYFVAQNVAWLRQHRPTVGMAMAAQNGRHAQVPGLDPRYPFQHVDRTADVLGPLFDVRPGPAPDLVFIVVEGLGRAFSGPDAAHGSFTPFLDALAARGLYWDNFLANQGRTFGVLPSLFGSLPFGDGGFAGLGASMPAHADLLSILGQQGYHVAFYSGWDASFDNERQYLQRQGVDDIVDIHAFAPAAVRANTWGYADGDLVDRVLADRPARAAGPTLTVIQTITMHTPYTFPGQSGYRARLEQRLDALGIAEADRARYRQFANIYESVLYTDDALRRYFDAAARDPRHANTIYIITGDHRLPELPMDTRIERYHVPLLIVSPLLRAPLRIRSVSSQMDVAPSLLAFLSHNYRLQRPVRATWVGSGLDVEPGFRNLHDIPLKQTKSLLTDFVSGTWFLNRGDLYALSDGMGIEPASDAATRARVEGRFAAFRAANDGFARAPVLSPEGGRPRMAAYANAAVGVQPLSVAAPAVRDVTVSTPSTGIHVEATFANDGVQATPSFVPLAVLVTADGREIGECYGAALRLGTHARQRVGLTFKGARPAPGHYFLAVIPSDPANGRSIGSGRYRIPVLVDQ